MNHFLKILLLCSLYGCDTYYFIDSDDIKGDVFEQKMVIYGSFTTAEKFHRVFVTGSVEKETVRGADTISGATVYIEGNGNIYEFIEAIDHPNISDSSILKRRGFYYSKDKVAAKINEQYTLHVIHEGKEYTASDKISEGTSPIDLNTLELPCAHRTQTPFGYYVEITFYKDIYWTEDENLIYNWRLSTLDDLHPEFINFYIQSDPELIPKVTPIERGLFSGFSGFNDTLYVSKINQSPQYTFYIKSLLRETVNRDVLFSSYPGNIPSNVLPDGFGFFNVSDEKTLVTTVGEISQMTGNTRGCHSF